MLPDKPYDRRSALPPDFDARRLAPRAADRACLMVGPEHFRVEYVINPHMRDAAGRPNAIDRSLAIAQWGALRDVYESLGFPVHVLSGDPALPDMVFAANQSFPFRDAAGRLQVILSAMHAKERRPEVAHFERWYRANGYAVSFLPVAGENDSLEGMGDILWVPGRRLLLAGHGFRTSAAAARSVAAIVEAPVFLFELRDPRFYHLDTAVAPLDGERALAYRGAFTEEGFDLLHAAFPRIIEVDEAEAAHGFACNAHAPDVRNVILDRSSPRAVRALQHEGFVVHALDLSEFHKSGGSVFCLKMMLP